MGFTGSKFNGESGVIRGGKISDTWVVLERYFLNALKLFYETKPVPRFSGALALFIFMKILSR